MINFLKSTTGRKMSLTGDTDCFTATADNYCEASVVSIFGGKGSLCNHHQTLPARIWNVCHVWESKKKKGGEFLSISPLQRVTNRGLSRGRLKATRCWARTRDPEPEKKRPLHLKHRTRAHYTNGEKVKSRASQMFVLHFVSGWKVVYSTSCPQEGGQCLWFAGKTGSGW